MKRWYAWLGLAVALGSLAPGVLAQTYSATADAGIFYVYDPVGRLVGVVTPTGQVAKYVYDPAGNITAIDRYDGGIQVLGFGPNGAAPGSNITIYGSGFVSGDTVTIGGQSATVDSVTGTEIVVTVPTGAAGGTVEVSGGGSSANSAWGLTVPDSGISISSFTPDAGDAGTLFTIYGAGFDPNPQNDVVLVNTTECTVVDAGATSLVVTVPYNATSGHVSVTNAIGTAVSGADFYMAPPGYDVSTIVATARGTIGGSAQTLSSVGSGQTGLLLFDAQAGDELGISVTSVSGYPTVYLLDPFGIQSIGLVAAPGVTSFPLPPLVHTGTYELAIEPTSTASIGLQIVADQLGVVDAGGSAVTYVASEVGQQGAFAFSGTVGQNLTLVVTSSTFADALTVNVFDLEGILLASGASTILKVPTLFEPSGSYVAVLSPQGTDTGQADIQLLQDVEGTLTVGGSIVPVFLVPGQYGHYTFSGTSGELLDFAFPGFSVPTFGDAVNVVVDSPPPQDFAGDWFSSVFYGADHTELPALPNTGSYDVWLEPETLFSFDGGIQLTPPVSEGALSVGTPATFSTSLVGQEGIYTFSGTAGQYLSIGLTSATFADYVAGRVYDPSWTYIAGTDPTASSSQTGAIDLPNLATSGTYTLVLEPCCADTGEVTVELFEDATATVATDGTETSISLAAGQRGEYTFSGTGGSYLGLGLTSLSTSPSGDTVYVTVYDPSGGGLALLTTAASTSYGLPELPADGTYTVRVEPYGAPTCTAELALVPAASGSLSLATPATKTFSEVGQEGRYTFSASEGGYYSLLASGATFADNAEVSVLDPSGAGIVDGYVYSGTDLVLDLTNLAATGTYTVVVVPYGTDTGNVTLDLFQDSTGTLATDGTPASISLAEGQRAEYTFSGTVGDYIGLGLTSLSTTPSGSYVDLTLYDPSGNYVTGVNTTTDTGTALAELSSTGTYTLRVEPYGPAAASFSLDLAEPLTGALTSGGSVVTFSSTIVGQEGVYTFSGTASDNDIIYVSSLTFVGPVSVTVYDPSNNVLDSQNFYAAGSMSPSSLPATGTYTVVVNPDEASTGSLGLQLN